jgi:hypothetical protein
MFERDPNDWLRKLSPDEWLRASIHELSHAEAAFRARDARGGIVGCKRAAGMALNAALIVEPRVAWGRTYVEHVVALEKEGEVPEAVRAACRVLLEAQPPGGTLVSLRTPTGTERVVEAAKDVMAHAYAIVRRHDPKEG